MPGHAPPLVSTTMLVLALLLAAATGPVAAAAEPGPRPIGQDSARPQTLAPMLPATPNREATEPIIAGPFSVRLASGITTNDSEGTSFTVTDVHPGAIAVEAGSVTNTDDINHDASLTFQLPDNGALVEPESVGPFGFTCEMSDDSLEVTCDAPEIAPEEKRVIYFNVRVAPPASGNACVHATVSEGTGEVLATTPDTCLHRTPWPDSVAGAGFDLGDVVPDLTLVNDLGNVRSLSDYRGSYVVLTISTVWCPPSQFETPQDRDEIAELGNDLGAPIHQVVVLVDGPTPSRQSTVADASDFRGDFDLPGHDVLATQDDTGLEAIQHLGALTPPAAGGMAFPTTAFITPEGRVFAIRVGTRGPGDTTDTLLDHPASPPPVLEKEPRILGTPSTKDSLQGTTGTWKGADDFASAWLRCKADGSDCAPIEGATKSKYRPVKADKGHRLVYRVTAFRRETGATARASIGGPRIENLTIRGTPRVGETVRADAAFKVAETLRFAWTRDGHRIAGADAAAYVVRAADRGHRLVVAVVATNALGQDRASAGARIRS